MEPSILEVKNIPVANVKKNPAVSLGNELHSNKCLVSTAKGTLSSKSGLFTRRSRKGKKNLRIFTKTNATMVKNAIVITDSRVSISLLSARNQSHTSIGKATRALEWSIQHARTCCWQ